MKKIIKIISLAGLVFLMFSLAGCYYDEVVPEGTIPSDKPVSFENDIIPIFNASCNFTSCHSPGGVSPDLTPVKAYNELFSEGLIDTNVPENSELYLWLAGKKSTPMPVSGVDPAINATILAWIRQGALNN